MNLAWLSEWQSERINTEIAIQNNIQVFENFSEAVKEVKDGRMD